MLPERTKHSAPYYVQQTPRGSVVVCAAHTVADELEPAEATALAKALNMEFQRRFSRA